MDVNLFIAFFAGVSSFFAPCSFGILPIVLTNLSGSIDGAKANKKTFLINTVLYSLGFATIFILLGIGISGIGRFFIAQSTTFLKLNGILLMLFGLFIIFGDRLKGISFLYQEKKIMLKPDTLGKTFLTPFLLGATNAFAWSPCIGPILGSILLLAGSTSSVLTGITFLLTYSAGMTFPLIIFALLFEVLKPKMIFLNKYSKKIYLIGGIMLIAIGLTLLLGIYNNITGFFYQSFSAFTNAS